MTNMIKKVYMEWFIVMEIKTRVQIILIALLSVLLFFGGIKYQEYRLAGIKIQAEIVQEDTGENVKEEVEETKFITVHVVGAVEKPGLYSLEDEKRIGDVIELAIPKPEADLTVINLAEKLTDGSQIYLPQKGEIKQKPIVQKNSQKVGKININTASAKELESLSGIGPVLAERIIDYREAYGSFAKIDELTKVSGIGPTVLKKIRDEITLN